MLTDTKTEIAALTSDVVAAYVANNPIPAGELPGLIRDVHTTLGSVARGEDPGASEPGKPAVPIRSSVKPAYIVCLEDGLRFKSLKRHLRQKFNMSPEDYRKRWGLPHDYPMVAPDYSKARSELAKKMGLGRRRRS